MSANAAAQPGLRQYSWQNPMHYSRDYDPDAVKIEDPQSQHPYFEGCAVDADSEEQNQPWRQLAQASNLAEALHFFSDNRQSGFEGKPLPDGSNIGVLITTEDGTQRQNGSRTLSRMFQLYRQWLQRLYRESLLEVVRNPSNGRFKFFPSLELSYEDDALISQINILEDTEHFEVPELDTAAQYGSVQDLRWVEDWRKKMANALQDMLAASEWATVWDEDEIEAMNQAYNNGVSGVNKVLISVLCKEQLFETRLYTAHVEDEHIVKRIRPLSTIDLTTVTSDTAGALDEEWLPALIRCLSIIQTKFRLLYNFRLLRDWGYQRPWAKLLQVFDTTDNPDLEYAVSRARELLLRTTETQRLFGVVPAKLSLMNQQAQCTVCLEDWQHDNLVMVTHCNHLFHAACLIQYWDQDRQFEFRCPLCRTPGGRIRSRVDFDPDRDDFNPNSTEAAVHDATISEIRDALIQDPDLIFQDLPYDYRLALGRELEKSRLEQALLPAVGLLNNLPIP